MSADADDAAPAADIDATAAVAPASAPVDPPVVVGPSPSPVDPSVAAPDVTAPAPAAADAPAADDADDAADDDAPAPDDADAAPAAGPPPLGARVPVPADGDAVVEVFLDWAEERGLALYPHQEEALLEVVAGNHVIVDTPTGSGKSLVGIAAIFSALAEGRRSFYTAPIKALVSEKFFELSTTFGPGIPLDVAALA